jgi:hypothetical protein
MVYRGRKKSSGLGRLFAACLVVAGGVTAFWFSLENFRAARVPVAEAPTEVLTTLTGVALAEEDFSKEVSASFISAFDGAATGSLTRSFEDHGFTFRGNLFLPAINQATEQYDIWVLRAGLSDVQYAGTLTPRADGTWVTTFRVAPETGYRDPSLYTTINIWRGPAGKPTLPTGTPYVSATLAPGE